MMLLLLLSATGRSDDANILCYLNLKSSKTLGILRIQLTAFQICILYPAYSVSDTISYIQLTAIQIYNLSVLIISSLQRYRYYFLDINHLSLASLQRFSTECHQHNTDNQATVRPHSRGNDRFNISRTMRQLHNQFKHRYTASTRQGDG